MAQAEWMKGLNEQERTILAVAKATHENIVLALGATGMCYRMSFFLTEYLKNAHGIEVVPVVAFVNDGIEEHLMISHAWIEFNGKKTDISLTQMAYKEQLTGPLLIHDRPLTHADVIYTYHHQRSIEAMARVDSLMQERRLRDRIAAKEQEHAQMVATAKSPARMRTYLDTAPDRQGYEALAGLIRHR